MEALSKHVPGIAVFYFDSTILQIGGSKQALWCKKGKKKYLLNTGNRQRKILSACIHVSSGETLFHVSTKLNSAEFINFLISLLGQFPGQKLFLIVDNASWHKSKATREFVAGQDRLHLVFLPAYSRELNPVEKLWKWMKNSLSKNNFYTQMSELSSAIADFCSLLHQNCQLVLQRVGLAPKSENKDKLYG